MCTDCVDICLEQCGEPFTWDFGDCKACDQTLPTRLLFGFGFSAGPFCEHCIPRNKAYKAAVSGIRERRKLAGLPDEAEK